ncbi:uncharacterized protein DUF1127 [Ciceribacter lividus]|uniref:Uncharacterized protein DUF1127 n=1 Tax=Ciceribacter lividus TaxID=1197950 RepID=A0A6I7HSZ6_9HYPH|nr:DUF1127 domain-containing protein [Ciceribacter lividus]RCW28009.1 uncharacterized protein DUF1127 [Ciceribacter lividus]
MDNFDPGRTRPRQDVLALLPPGRDASTDTATDGTAAECPLDGSARAGSWLAGVVAFFLRMRKKQRTRRALYGLSDQTLKDIGVSRGQIDGDFDRYRRSRSYGLERLTRL